MKTEKSKQPFSKKKALRLGILLLLAAAFLIFIIRMLDQHTLETSFYEVRSDKVSNNIRVVAIADMHLKEFGKDNSELVAKVASYGPDLITIVGDMNVYGKEDYSPVITLCEQLVKVAPVYYSLGNHEYSAKLFDKQDITKDISDTGVHLLNNRSETVTVQDTQIEIGGLSENPKQFEEFGHDFFDQYIQNDKFKLLLVHYPEEFQGTLEDYPIDLAICGHAHGGLIRIPKIGGIYAPDQGFFPELTEGYHEIGNSKVIITRGLSNSNPFPRINNRPEVCVIDICWY